MFASQEFHENHDSGGSIFNIQTLTIREIIKSFPMQNDRMKAVTTHLFDLKQLRIGWPGFGSFGCNCSHIYSRFYEFQM
jgi:hypothetical protein